MSKSAFRQPLPWLRRHLVVALLLHLLLAWGLYAGIRWLRAQVPPPPERPYVVIELVTPSPSPP
ncbi:hypothetical protein JN531_005920 [Flagellatimonas centrodinii]|uniref:hypothetical protein n=1 Tax=Flagellatimonas centrodinii TaxID=2806210 RepID=UPI001FED7B86|nr:hypothetical protein [Flagellatimonas centrodinii]ULQ47825.1 hypothetical protein JN531_005920 [Flagellatimonas centrodinii]